MFHHGKKYINAKSHVDLTKQYTPAQAIEKVKESAYARFDESMDVDINLGIDPTKGEQVVRGSVVLPHGRGKKVKIAAFVKGDYVQAAEQAGADYIGAEDLIERIEKGLVDFDFAVATPDLMGMVGKVAKILGPRGLVPSKKAGTVTFDIAQVVGNLKKGQLFFKNDKMGIVHFSFGLRSFDTQKLADNLNAFFKALVASKPAAAKGKFINKVTVTSTMGIGVQVNPEELL